MTHSIQSDLRPQPLEERLSGLLRRYAGGHGKGLLSLTVQVPDLDFAGLPHRLPEHQYWANPAEGLFLLGMGCAAQVETQGEGRFRALEAAFSEYRRHWQALDVDACGLQPAALAGFAFDQDARGQHLPNARLTIPLILLQRRGNVCVASFTCDREAATEKTLASWMAIWLTLCEACSAARPAAVQPRRSVSRISSSPPDAVWLELTRSAIEDIHAGLIDKLVLTRRIQLRSERPFEPAAVMAVLAERYPGCFRFSHAEAGRGAFLGATPERLVSLRGGEVTSAALAGTTWGLASEAELGDDKTLREHRLVVSAIVRALEPACSLLHIPARPEVLELQDLRHLKSVVKGKAKSETTLLGLVERLHPTPAVGGYPVCRAQQWLADHCEARLDWYSGATGWLGLDGDGDFAVALRCAWMDGAEAQLLAGAGIVAGSDPAAELAETEAKLDAMRFALEQS